MSTAPATVSKPRGRKAAPPPPATPIAPAPTAIAETAVKLIAFPRLERAQENVRHTREHEDVQELADDIAGHGLLQSLIGYEGDDKTAGEGPTVFIVGGGRRLAALWLLHTRGVIDDDYRVPVLIRDQAEAIELSLAENLARRDMSPVDEFFAFRHMRANGAEPQDLARRFGFSERYVKQRLRLADLHSEILDALSERIITIDAAMAYASSQDTAAQLRVYKAQAKSNWKPHDPNAIRQDLQNKSYRSSSAIVTFVGAAAYEAAGGGYEDDLFTAAVDPENRTLVDTPLIERLAREKLQDELIGFVSRANAAGAGINAGAIIAPGIDISLWTWAKPKAPAGFTMIDCPYDGEKRWNAARNCGAQVKGIVGLDSKGEMKLAETVFFVSNDKLKEVRPPEPKGEPYRAPTEAERLEAQRQREIATWSRRLATGGFADTKFAGVAFWPKPWERGAAEPYRHPTLGEGFLVSASIFVTAEQAAEQISAAEAKIAEMAAEEQRAEEARRRAETASQDDQAARAAAIAAMTPEPAVIESGEGLWFRHADGSYWDVSPDSGDVGEYSFDELTQLLAEVPELGAAHASVEAWLSAAPAGDAGRDPDRPDPYDDELDVAADEDAEA